jgi:hypothetical protein
MTSNGEIFICGRQKLNIPPTGQLSGCLEALDAGTTTVVDVSTPKNIYPIFSFCDITCRMMAVL